MRDNKKPLALESTEGLRAGDLTSARALDKYEKEGTHGARVAYLRRSCQSDYPPANLKTP